MCVCSEALATAERAPNHEPFNTCLCLFFHGTRFVCQSKQRVLNCEGLTFSQKTCSKIKYKTIELWECEEPSAMICFGRNMTQHNIKQGKAAWTKKKNRNEWKTKKRPNPFECKWGQLASQFSTRLRLTLGQNKVKNTAPAWCGCLCAGVSTSKALVEKLKFEYFYKTPPTSCAGIPASSKSSSGQWNESDIYWALVCCLHLHALAEQNRRLSNVLVRFSGLGGKVLFFCVPSFLELNFLNANGIVERREGKHKRSEANESFKRRRALKERGNKRVDNFMQTIHCVSRQDVGRTRYRLREGWQ